MNKLAVLIILSAALTACVTSNSGFGEKDDESAAAYNLQLGIDYFRQGNLAQAKEKLDRSLEQNPKNPQTYVASGMLYDRLGETRKADQLFSKAVDLDPKNGDSVNSYAVFLCRKGDYAKGEQLALQAAANPLYKSPEASYFNAGNCALDAGKDSRAEEHFRRALALRPNFAAALLQMAELEFKAGNYLPARGFLERFQQVAKPTAASLWLLCRVENALGNAGLSADYARRLKQDFPTSIETKALLEFEKEEQILIMGKTPETSEATTPGALLKQARERAGLSVERVAKELYLDTQIIRTIEINHFNDLGAPVYAKGYLRKYAKLVGVSEEEILQGYQQLGGTSVPDPIPASMGSVPETRKPLPRWVWWGVVALLILAGLVTLLNLRDSDSDGAQQNVMISRPFGGTASDAATADSPLAALPGATAMSADTMGSALTLAFRFSADSWVEVHDAGNRQVLYELGVTNSTRQIRAVPPLRVVLGAAQAVSVQVNSRAVVVPEKNIHDGVGRFVVKADGSVE